MFGFLRRTSLSQQERVALQDYLRTSRQQMDVLQKEFQDWLQGAGDSNGQLHLQGDPTGQNASVYLWRVAGAARDFVEHEPPKIAGKYHEAFRLCLEARGAAADTFREAADRAAIADPAAKIKEANMRLEQAQDELENAREAIADIERKLASA